MLGATSVGLGPREFGRLTGPLCSRTSLIPGELVIVRLIGSDLVRKRAGLDAKGQGLVRFATLYVP